LKNCAQGCSLKLEILADAAKPHSRDEWGRSRKVAATGLRSPIGTRENECASLDHGLSSIQGASRALLAQQLHVVCADPRVRGGTPERGAAAPCIPHVA
jgi:hypothetical protein